MCDDVEVVYCVKCGAELSIDEDEVYNSIVSDDPLCFNCYENEADLLGDQ